MMDHQPYHNPGSELSKRERKKYEISDRISKLEQDTIKLKDKVYKEKLDSLNNELKSLASNTNQRFKLLETCLGRKRDEDIKQAQMYKEYQIQFQNRVYEDQIKAYTEEYESHRSNLKSKMISHLQEKKKRLREDRDLLDTTIVPGLNDTTTANSIPDDDKPVATRKTNRINAANRFNDGYADIANGSTSAPSLAAVTTTGSTSGRRRGGKSKGAVERIPQLGFILDNNDQLDDISELRKATSTATTSNKRAKYNN